MSMGVCDFIPYNVLCSQRSSKSLCMRVVGNNLVPPHPLISQIKEGKQYSPNPYCF